MIITGYWLLHGLLDAARVAGCLAFWLAGALLHGAIFHGEHRGG